MRVQSLVKRRRMINYTIFTIAMIILVGNLSGTHPTVAQIDIGPGHFYLDARIDDQMISEQTVFTDFSFDADHEVWLQVRVGERAVRILELDLSINYWGQSIFTQNLRPEDFGLGEAVILPPREVYTTPFYRVNLVELAEGADIPIPLDILAVGRFELGFTITYEVEIGGGAIQSTSTATTPKSSTLVWVEYVDTINFDVVIPAEPTDYIATVPGAVGTTSGVVTIAIAGKAAAAGPSSTIKPAPRTAGAGLVPSSAVAPTKTGIQFIGERMPAAVQGSVNRRLSGVIKRRAVGERCPQCGVAWPKGLADQDLCPGCSKAIETITEPRIKRARDLSLRALGILATFGIIPIYDLASQLDISDLEAVETAEILEESGLLEGTSLSIKGVTGSMAKASIPAIITTFFYAQLTGLAAMDIFETILLSIASIVGFTLLGIIISKIRKPKLPEDVKAELQRKAAETETLEPIEELSEES